MKISQALEGEKVRLIHIHGDVFEGRVGDYIYPEDNEPEGIAAIDIDYPLRNGKKVNAIIGFNENEIASIEIIR